MSTNRDDSNEHLHSMLGCKIYIIIFRLQPLYVHFSLFVFVVPRHALWRRRERDLHQNQYCMTPSSKVGDINICSVRIGVLYFICETLWQSDQGLRCPLTESLNTIDCINGEKLPRWDLTYAQNDVNLHILCLLEGLFSLDAAHISMIDEKIFPEYKFNSGGTQYMYVVR